jgi:hypothetical protein
VPVLPTARGPLTEGLFTALAESPGRIPLPAVPDCAEPLGDEDLQLALYVCYELHYRGFDEVAPRWEWDPSLLALRAELEGPFERALRRAVGPVPADVAPEAMDTALREVESADDGPSLSRFVARESSLDQILEFMVHRSAYQLKEADPHSWALPRLSGGPKAAMVEIQADEYGGGRADRVHAELFARSMHALGLDREYGAYLDHIPGVTLATVNLMSLFGLHRRLRGSLVGHLALFEMTSSVPNRRYGDGLRRLGQDEATPFFDEHVEADAVHENIASVDLAGGLVSQDPAMAQDVLFGARALALLDRRWADHVLESWEAGDTSLHRPLGAALAAS